MKNYKYKIGDVVVIVSGEKDMMKYIGDKATVKSLLPIDYLNDYYIETENHEIFKVKEKEIAPIENKELLNIKIGQKVIYTPTNELGEIYKIDFYYGHVGMKFEKDGSTAVTGIESIRKIENEGEGMEKIADKDLHKKILDEIHDTYVRKNADYGNSFGDQYKEYGLLSAVIRLDDKFRRLKQLMKQDAQVKDESIRDTVLDAANYAIMTVMELDKK